LAGGGGRLRHKKTTSNKWGKPWGTLEGIWGKKKKKLEKSWGFIKRRRSSKEKGTNKKQEV